MSLIRAFIVCAAVLLPTLALAQAGPTRAAAAAQDRPLPDFLVQDPDGHDIASSVMAAQAKWLLIYVTPDCRPCNTLLRAMPRWRANGLSSRVVLVVSGPRPAAKQWVEKMLAPELQLTWYADPDRAAARALELSGAPVLIGVRNGAVEWQVGGVLNDPAALESVVRSWVEDRQ
jgi:hypothetical protein